MWAAADDASMTSANDWSAIGGSDWSRHSSVTATARSVAAAALARRAARQLQREQLQQQQLQQRGVSQADGYAGAAANAAAATSSAAFPARAHAPLYSHARSSGTHTHHHAAHGRQWEVEDEEEKDVLDRSSCSGSDEERTGPDWDAPQPLAAALAAARARAAASASAASPPARPVTAAAVVVDSSPAAVAARRLRTAMRNTTAALRKELRETAEAAAAEAELMPRWSSAQQRPPYANGAPATGSSAAAASVAVDGRDQLPPPLPVLQGRRSDPRLRLPYSGFGGGLPCCAAPVFVRRDPGPEAVLNGLAEQAERQSLIQRLQEYDQARGEPGATLSPQFLNRVVYDCQAAPVFAQRWVPGRSGPQGRRCECRQCRMHRSSGLGTAESTRADAAAFAPASAPSDASPSAASIALFAAGSSSVDPAASPSSPLSSSSSSSSCPSGGRWATSVRSYYTPTSASDRTLVFESRFESGNLRAACQVSEFEYDLTLSPDRHTSHHTQWYFFRIGNTRAGATYKLNVLNFTKANSLYNAGMRPLVYSVTEAAQSGGGGGRAPFTDEEAARPFDIPPVDAAAAAAAGVAPPDSSPSSSSFSKLGRGWHRAGSNIAYYRSAVPRGSSRHAYFYALSFCLRAEHDHDTLYVAHCYPYTYSDWNADLAALEEDPARAQFVRRRTLCKTLAGNEVDELTIADFSIHTTGAPIAHLQPNYPAVPASGEHQWPNHHQEQQQPLHQQLPPRRPVVLVMARVHPGESNSSWMMRGLLDFLTSPDDPSAAELRRRVVFKLVPVLGVDGVVVGNYRCSLSGADLNRTWREPSQVAHPEIYATKQLVARIVREQGRHLLLAVDLHGHSRKKNIFMYGCPAPPPPPPQLQQQRTYPSAHHSSSSSVFITAPSGSGSASASPLWSLSSLHPDLSAPLLSLSAAERSHFNATSDPAAAAASPSAIAITHAPHRRKSSKRSKKRCTGTENATALLANLNPNRLCERILPRMLARETIAAAEARAAQQAAEADPSYPASIVSAAVVRAEALGAPGSPHATGFSLRECSFSISPGKESTARAVLFREMGVANSYTLEASFCGGGSIGALAGVHFNQRHFQRMGEALGRAVLEFIDPAAYEAERAALQRAGVPPERRSKKYKGGGKSAAALDEGGDDSDDSTSSTDVLGPSIPLTATTVRQAPKRKGGKKQKKQQDAPEASTPVLGSPPLVAPLSQRDFAPGSSYAPGSALLVLAAANGPNATNSTSSFSSAPRPGGGGARLARDKMRVVWAAHQSGSKENEVEAALDALRAAEEAAARVAQREDKRRQAKQQKMAAAHYKRQAAAAAAAELATLGGDLAPLRRAHARARSASRAGGAGSRFSESPPAPMRASQPFPSAYATAVAGSNPLLPPPPPPVGLGVSSYFRPTPYTAMQQRMASTSAGLRSAKPSAPSLLQPNGADPPSTVDSREPHSHQRPPSPPRAPTVRFSNDWQTGPTAKSSAAEPAIRTARPSSAFPYTARRSMVSSSVASVASAAQAPSFTSASNSATSVATLSARGGGGRGLPPRSSGASTHRRSSSLTADPLGTTLHSMSVSATRFGEDLLPAPVSVASTFAAVSSKQQRTASAGVRRGSSNAPSASPPLLAFGSNLRSASPPAASAPLAPGGNHTSTNADLLQLSGLAMAARPVLLGSASAAAAGTAASGPRAKARPSARRLSGSGARGQHVGQQSDACSACSIDF